MATAIERSSATPIPRNGVRETARGAAIVVLLLALASTPAAGGAAKSGDAGAVSQVLWIHRDGPAVRPPQGDAMFPAGMYSAPVTLLHFRASGKLVVFSCWLQVANGEGVIIHGDYHELHEGRWHRREDGVIDAWSRLATSYPMQFRGPAPSKSHVITFRDGILRFDGARYHPSTSLPAHALDRFEFGIGRRTEEHMQGEPLNWRRDELYSRQEPNVEVWLSRTGS